jgi:hypothetical protein
MGVLSQFERTPGRNHIIVTKDSNGVETERLDPDVQAHQAVVRQNVTTGRSFPRLVCQPVDFVAPAMLRPCKGSTRERKLARAVLIGTMRVAQSIPVDRLPEAMD